MAIQIATQTAHHKTEIYTHVTQQFEKLQPLLQNRLQVITAFYEKLHVRCDRFYNKNFSRPNDEALKAESEMYSREFQTILSNETLFQCQRFFENISIVEDYYEQGQEAINRIFTLRGYEGRILISENLNSITGDTRLSVLLHQDYANYKSDFRIIQAHRETMKALIEKVKAKIKDSEDALTLFSKIANNHGEPPLSAKKIISYFVPKKGIEGMPLIN